MTTDEHMEAFMGVIGSKKAFMSGDFEAMETHDKGRFTGFTARVSLLKRGDQWLLRFRKKPWTVEVKNDPSGPYPTGPGFLLTHFFDDDERGHAGLNTMESVLDYIQGIFEPDAK